MKIQELQSKWFDRIEIEGNFVFETDSRELILTKLT